MSTMHAGRLLLLVALWTACANGAQQHSADYRRFLEPLLDEPDLGTPYVDDGAGDGTVLQRATGAAREKVRAITGLGERSLPLLIECLADSRETRIRFTRPKGAGTMLVPLGYVCLDILMQVTDAPETGYEDCADDGLGACKRNEYYVLPDEWRACRSGRCGASPAVLRAQRHWKRLLARRRLRFRVLPDSAYGL
jgi:hypothetical protein